VEARPRPTVRVRLTLLYTGMFAVCGAILVAITYGLVAGTLPAPAPDPAAAAPTPKPTAAAHAKAVNETLGGPAPADFAAACETALDDPSADPALRAKCEAAYREGLLVGARTQREATLSQLLRYSLTTLAVVALLAAAAGWIVAGRVLRPVHRITAAARDASGHSLASRVALTGPRDELRELADTFDAMLDRLQAVFEGQRRFIANAGHELRTPLTVMRAAVDVVLAKPSPTPAELVGMAEEVRAEVDYAEALIEALLTLARTDRPTTGPVDRVDLATVVEDALDAAALPPATRSCWSAWRPTSSTTPSATTSPTATSGSRPRPSTTGRCSPSRTPAPRSPRTPSPACSNRSGGCATARATAGSGWGWRSSPPSRRHTGGRRWRRHARVAA
jgi:HAMP domain-containing protein